MPDTVHLAPGEDGGGVVEGTFLVDEAHDGGAAPAGGGHAAQRPQVALHERRFDEEILRRVAGEHQLGEESQISALVLGGGERADHLLDVAVEVADGRIELAQGDAQVAHRASLRRRLVAPSRRAGTGLHCRLVSRYGLPTRTAQCSLLHR